MYLQIMYLLYFSCPAMGIGQTQGTFYIPKQPHIVQQLRITLTQAEQQVYNAARILMQFCDYKLKFKRQQMP